jgi:hypothetical protein
MLNTLCGHPRTLTTGHYSQSWIVVRWTTIPTSKKVAGARVAAAAAAAPLLELSLAARFCETAELATVAFLLQSELGMAVELLVKAQMKKQLLFDVLAVMGVADTRENELRLRWSWLQHRLASTHREYA